MTKRPPQTRREAERAGDEADREPSADGRVGKALPRVAGCGGVSIQLDLA